MAHSKEKKINQQKLSLKNSLYKINCLTDSQRKSRKQRVNKMKISVMRQKIYKHKNSEAEKCNNCNKNFTRGIQW